MASTQSLDIKVVYSAAQRRRPGRTVPIGLGAAASPAKGWLLLGVVNSAMALGLYYVTWWRVDPFFYITTIMHTPIKEEEIARLIPVTQEGVRALPIDLKQLTSGEKKNAYSADTTRIILGAVSYGWLALATLSFGLVALAAGASWSRAGANRWQSIWIILALGTLLALLCAAALTWQKYGAKYPPNHLRFGMAGLGGLALLAGLTVRRFSKGVNRMAGLGLILSAVGSAVGLYLLGRCAAVEPVYASLPVIVMVFAVHSFYGWLLLLPLTTRLGRP